MRLTIIFALALFSLVQPLAMAQQAGENINVLPVVFPQDDPDWELKGDGYLQRQVEPSIAASTRNPDHLVAFFNDYRAVDIANDVGLGETETMVALVNIAREIMMAASWLPLPELHLQPRAAAEAWVGMSRSYDGGLTWSGAFLPGGPFDTSSASTASPVYGLQAATDPVVAPGPCGKFYVVFMAFTRGDESSSYPKIRRPGYCFRLPGHGASPPTGATEISTTEISNLENKQSVVKYISCETNLSNQQQHL